MSQTSPSDFDRAHQILNDCLEIEPDQQESFVRERCDGDLALERVVNELLEAHQQTLSWVDSPDPGRWLSTGLIDDVLQSADKVDRRVGSEIGPYLIVRELGAGGMGVVYEAEQFEPVKRRVALKLIRPGMDSQEVTRRFELERQTLFSLEHPYVSRAYDAGITESGHPYFVMELVLGQPLTTFCDEERLDLEERIELFLKLCRAVQYAHVRGIIHRDLKPSNVLVTRQDGVAVPKVIDFGIAKALGGSELDGIASSTVMGAGAQPIGTPETMSPEQAMGDSLDVRTDVYSAGVVLYRLLAGCYPFSSEKLRGSDWSNVQKILSERMPDAPSSLARKDPDTPEVVSSLPTPRRLELDWIVLKALAKEPDQRYQSMEDLALDLERFLKHEAVEAGPVAWTYTARKFVVRHLVAVAVTALFALVLVGAAAGLGIQAARLKSALDDAEARREEAEQVSALMSGIFGGADPYAQGTRDTTALELLERGEVQVRETLSEQPTLLAAMLQRIGVSRRELADYEPAAALIEEAIETQRTGANKATLAGSLADLAAVRSRQSRLEDAVGLTEEAVTVAKESKDVPVVLRTLLRHADVLRRLSRLDEAEVSVFEAIDLAQSESFVSPAIRHQTQYTLAIVWMRQGRASEALEVLLELQSSLPSTGQGLSPGVIADRDNTLGALLVELGRSAEAIPYLERALDHQKDVLGPGHISTLSTRTNLALAASNVGQLEAARDMNLESLEVMRAASSEPHAYVASLLNNLGLNHHGLGDLGAARETFLAALEEQRQVVGDDHPNLAYHLSNLARVDQEEGRFDEAETNYRRALALRDKHLPEDHPAISDTEVWLGSLLLETGRAREARSHLERGVAIRESKLKAGSWRIAEARSWLGMGLVAEGDVERGLEMVVEAYPVIREQRGDHWHRTPAALERVIAAYEAAGKDAEAANFRRLHSERHPTRPLPTAGR